MGDSPTIAIIGAGAGGLLMGIRLKRAGIDSFTIFERSDGVGGTWRDNAYPGAACDIQSHMYSYSFELNPNWSRPYGTQPELLAYFEHCADKYHLRPHLRCNLGIAEARWDDDGCHWNLTAEDGSTHEADILVSALGMLNAPNYSDIPGLEDFRGSCFHSARWDHGIDLQGKRIGSIGTGASSVQFLPEVAKVAKRLHIFQRSPVWVMPKVDDEFTEEERADFARLGRARLHRWKIFARYERMTSFRVADKTTSERESIARAHLARVIPDEDLRKRLTPDFPIGCKRLLLTNDYLPIFNRDNVELVTSRISRVTPNGVRTEDGREREIDVLILGTGFKASEHLGAVDIYGESGRRLADQWADGAEAHLGITVKGFPNLFMLYGPNTNQGGNSIIFIHESQVHYIMQAVRRLRRKRGALTVKGPVQDAYNAKIQKAMAGTVWDGGCTNYFRGPSGKITTQFPYPARQYWAWTRRFKANDFEFVSKQVPEHEPSRR
jgi:cyclohexanone monooxygenase